jgi:hypothetical protein
MWLATTLIAALIATLLRIIFKKKYKLGFLSLMLWGATIMILVDHVLEYRGGNFLEFQTNGIIKNSALLGIFMLFPVIFIWLAANLSSKLKRTD